MRFRVVWVVGLICLLLVFRFAPRLVAHDVDVTGVARLFLDETADGRYRLSVVDRMVAPITDVERVLPTHCTADKSTVYEKLGVSGFTFDCQDRLTASDTLIIPWPVEGVVVVARWSDGTDASAYFRGKGQVVPVHLGDLRAGIGSTGRLVGRYLLLGGEHILFGVDHLLFVAGLLVLVTGPWLLVKTITSFTLAHSITLAAAVFGLVPVASAPVEATIALSIVLLAREIVVGPKRGAGLVYRHPWVVAFVFGLLHGFGFATALGEIGLRSEDVPLALLSFNIGIEGAQLFFVLLLIAVRRMSDDLRGRVPYLRPASGYVLGTVAMFWFFERLPGVWEGRF